MSHVGLGSSRRRAAPRRRAGSRAASWDRGRGQYSSPTRAACADALSAVHTGFLHPVTAISSANSFNFFELVENAQTNETFFRATL